MEEVFVELQSVLDIVAKYCPDAGTDLREMLDDIGTLPEIGIVMPKWMEVANENN